LTDPHPTEFSIRYQIPPKDYFFNLEWDGDRLFLKEFSLESGIDQQKDIKPEIHDWNDEYVVSCKDSCVEGDEWEVNLVYGDQNLEAHGANSYPPTFREFLKATEELTGIIIEFIQQD
jgi:hypothetical protein